MRFLPFFKRRPCPCPVPFPMYFPTAGAVSPAMMGPSAVSPAMMGPSAVSPAYSGSQCGYPPVNPPQVLPTQVMPAQYSQMKQNNEYKEQNYVVPMIHPSQTTQYNQTNVNYVHYFPHTKKAVNNVSQKHFCGGTYQQGY